MPNKDKRLKEILLILQAHPTIHNNTLQNLTKSSTSTLRRDLVELENRGLIQRSFGEIRLINQDNLEYSWGFRDSNHLKEKEKIGSLASHFVEDNDAIFIDASTTSIHVLDHLNELSGVKIITNCLAVAEKAQLMPSLTTFVSGGEIKPLSNTSIGIDANNYLSQYHCKLAFISSSTIDENGLYMADISQTQIKRTMIDNSTIVLALLDHSKFTNNNNFVKLCDLNKLDYLITDRQIPDGPTLQALKENRVNVKYKRFGLSYQYMS